MRLQRFLSLAGLLLSLACQAKAGPPPYRSLAETRYGKAWTAERSDAPTVADAVRLTLTDAAGHFGAKPKVRSAYEDARSHRSGGATFTVEAGGTALKGWLTCELDGKRAKVTVAVIRADAPPGEWRRLLQAGGAGTGVGPEQAAAPAEGSNHGLPKAASASLRSHAFEDGVATVGLAEGWSTPTRAAMDGIQLVGPANQAAWTGMGFAVQVPGSSLASLPGSFVAPFSTPLQAFQALVPQLSRRAVARGGPATALDHLAFVADLPPALPNGRQALLRYGVTERRRDGSSTHYQAVAQVELDPVGQGAYRFSTTGARAPDASFERDLPVMLQMLQSVKYDDERVRAATGRRLDAQNQWFANQQRGYQAQQAANEAQHQRYWDGQRQSAQRSKDWEDRQLAQSRSNDDFSESMRGYRTVEDTRTGERRSADYLNVDTIVEELNRGDPDRYRQIPLRDELHPLDGR